MPRTQIGTTLIEDGSVRRVDINTTTTGSALITKLLVNSPLTISSTGVDSGTGDVTLGLSTAGLVTSFNSRQGAVTLSGTDVTTALGFTPISGESDTLQTVTTRGSITTNPITVGGLTTKGASNSGITPVLLLDSNGTNPNEAVDIKLANTTNPKGIRIIASDSLSAVPDGASIQFYNNASANFPGQFYLDSGAHNNAALIFRTAPDSTAITERMRILSNGNILIGTSTDSGYKLDVNGNLRASGTIVDIGGDSSLWNQAYTWGDHAAAGYITGTTGFTGQFTVPTNPPGMQTLNIVNGLIISIT